MSVSDPVADMLTKVRNAAVARHEKVDIPASKLKLEIVKILKTEGYIKNFKKITQDNKTFIRIFLKYDEAEHDIIKSGFLEEAPNFFSDDTKQRILMMRIIEIFCNEEQTTMDDLLGAVINPSLCRGKVIVTTEDTDKCVLEVKLSESN